MRINQYISPYRDKGTISRLNGGFIVLHYTANATGDAYDHCKYFAQADRSGGAHYFVGYKGDVWQSCPDEDISWGIGCAQGYKTAARNANVLNIELCCKHSGNWYFEQATVDAAVELVQLLMNKYNIPVDKVLRHYDCVASNKLCPEPWVRDNNAWQEFKRRLAPAVAEIPNEDAVWLRNCTVESFIDRIGTLCTEDQKKTGILACVSLAQAMLESGVGHSELACGAGASAENIAYNKTAYGGRNLFAMKRDISVGTWESTVWDGSTYSIWTSEQNPDGSYINMYRPFRSYKTIADSIQDHSEYLAKAKKPDGSYRYDIVGKTNVEEAIDGLHTGTLEGYATSLNYKKNLLDRIKKYGLEAYNYIAAYEPWVAKVVNCTELNVRNAPNGAKMVLAFDTLPIITVIGENNDSDGDMWYHVNIGGIETGYVWHEYLER